MPQGGNPKKIEHGCPNCGADAYEINWRDGFGQIIPLEIHCNQCGWAIDSENGVLRSPGRKLPESGSFRSVER